MRNEKYKAKQNPTKQNYSSQSKGIKQKNTD